ncbi:COP9 signalosome complex subunit 12 [Xylona heveae TC161]|uniref:Protein CSN12 homolog n=1 Tax=Xylona heveae (strain CBS 132557 / TC161) TaxID=1328760 RepID=A0A165GDF2_XYLHT|nr:COP9 signalosome complex subunit 12 [Xylona heveae TC161]KZF22058.1 COP9 signalosome complex subunit 12 [Xylona heveae TC161]
MQRVFETFKQAQRIGSGPLLSSTLSPVAPPEDPNRLYDIYTSSNETRIISDARSAIIYQQTGYKLSKAEGNAWVDIYAAYWKAVGQVIATETDARAGTWSAVYDAWKELANLLIKGYQSADFEAWTLPCLYVTGKYLRTFAIKADDQARRRGTVTFSSGFQDDIVSDYGKNDKLEDAARVINRIFTLCISDRAPLEESRKWGLYYVINLLFKTYFKLNSVPLSKNILRALQANRTDMPVLESFPASHIVTFKYYVGVISFLEEDYVQAEEALTYALALCHKDARKNRELLLTYLIPCRLLTTQSLPSAKLLAAYPHLEQLFKPICQCIKKGDLAGYDKALIAGEEEFVKRRIYLTLERGRDIALRNLLRKVFIAGGFETPKDGGAPIRRTRVPVAEFAAAIRIGSEIGQTIDTDEVECMLANMIYKGLMKGYIARERGIVVLSKGGTAFPGTGV